MIIGIGNDIVRIERIEKILTTHKQRFMNRCFTKHEQEKASKSKNPAATLAKRFAAKEALAKALGTGFINNIYLKNISVIENENGKPQIILSGGAEQMLKTIIPANHKPVIHLSLSDDPPVAQAFVIIEAIAENIK